MIAATTYYRFDVSRLRQMAGAMAVGGAAMVVLVAFFNPVQMCRGYLVAIVYVVGLPLGSLALRMIHALTGGAWGEQLRPGLNAATRTLPLTLVAAVPLLFVIPMLYPWASAESNAHLHFQGAYLNVPFFVSRALGCGAVWVLLHFLLQWLGPEGRVKVSGVGLVLYGLTVSIASIDWVMSLEPPWASTIFPAMFAIGQGLQAAALAVAACMMLTPIGGSLAAGSMRDLGNLLLMFVMLWAYLSFSQFLLVWSGNLAEEIPWYLRRLRGGWEWIALMLIAFQFLLPFVLLLSRAVKQRPAALAAVAILVLAMRCLDVFWWIEAAPVHESNFFWIADLAAVAAIGGAWVWEFGRQFQRTSEGGAA